MDTYPFRVEEDQGNRQDSPASVEGGLMSAKLIYVLSSFHMLFCAFCIHIHIKLIKFSLNFFL